MTREVVETIIVQLNEGKKLISGMNKKSFTDKGTGPYYSSIGQHFRHILDILSCILNGLEEREIDLSNRKRDKSAEENISLMTGYIKVVQEGLHAISNKELNLRITVKDDLGFGLTGVPYTLGGILCQALSHTVHHYACISYILHTLGLPLPAERFGVNPTTPEKPCAH